MASIAQLIINNTANIDEYDKESKIEDLENAIANLEYNHSDDEDYQLLSRSLDNYFAEIEQMQLKIKSEIIAMIDHECEVFDPICDGPVEHAEGMAMVRDLVEKYFDDRGV
jgi:t-SNARE complex subunit (syntaxin)